MQKGLYPTNQNGTETWFYCCRNTVIIVKYLTADRVSKRGDMCDDFPAWRVSPKDVNTFGRPWKNGIKCTWLTFNAEMFIYQSKAMFDVKFCLVKAVIF